MTLRSRLLVPLVVLLLLAPLNLAMRVIVIHRLDQHTGALVPVARLEGLCLSQPPPRTEIEASLQTLREMARAGALPEEGDRLVEQASTAADHPENALHSLEQLQARLELAREADLSQASWLVSLLLAQVVLLLWLFGVSLSIERSLLRVRTQLSTLSERLANLWGSQESLATQQAEASQEASQTVSGMIGSLTRLEQQTNLAAQHSSQAERLTQDGLGVVEANVELYKGLQQRFEAVANQMLKLSEQVGRITSVTRLTRELSAQTNILALNASVEAARAGDQGSGFAVVAGEIRELASQSRRSGEEIAELVSAISAVNDSTAMTTEEGSRFLQQGNLLSLQAWEVFTRLSEIMQQAQQQLGEGGWRARERRESLLALEQLLKSLCQDARSLSSEMAVLRPELLSLRNASQELNGVLGQHD